MSRRSWTPAARTDRASEASRSVSPSLPARRPYAFWVTTALVLVAGIALSLRNYERGLRSLESHHEPVMSNHSQHGPAASDSSPAAFETSTDLSTASNSPSRLPRLCLSLSFVLLASVIAGFSIAQLLDRPAAGFRSIEEAQRTLPILVLGAVPIGSELPA